MQDVIFDKLLMETNSSVAYRELILEHFLSIIETDLWTHGLHTGCVSLSLSKSSSLSIQQQWPHWVLIENYWWKTINSWLLIFVYVCIYGNYWVWVHANVLEILSNFLENGQCKCKTLFSSTTIWQICQEGKKRWTAEWVEHIDGFS